MARILITGASNGIGRALAARLKGHELVLAGRDAARLAEVSRDIPSARIITPDFADGTLIGNLVLSAVYLALAAVFALGVGTILRSSAGGIAAALGAILLLPTIFQLIAGITQAQWAADVLPYLLSNAGTGMYTESFDGSGLEQWQNALVVLVWVAVSFLGGAVLLKRRDA